MTSRLLLRVAVLATLVTLALSAAVGTAQAERIFQFKGTQEQVAAACKKLGIESTSSTWEGRPATSCVNVDKNTVAICNDRGNCAGQTPRAVIGLGGIGWLGDATSVVTRQPTTAPAPVVEMGWSLSSPSTDTIAPSAAPAPAPTDCQVDPNCG